MVKFLPILVPELKRHELRKWRPILRAVCLVLFDFRHEVFSGPKFLVPPSLLHLTFIRYGYVMHASLQNLPGHTKDSKQIGSSRIREALRVLRAVSTKPYLFRWALADRCVTDVRISGFSQCFLHELLPGTGT